jgi:ABC-2 type transport system ATP-binding protein
LIRFDKLTKRFKTITAVSELDLEIHDGEIFGLLGPNGAGKTTVLLILSTVLRPSAGAVYVNGVDVAREPERARAQIGIAFQEAVLDPRLTVQQNLYFHAEVCRLPRDVRKRRIEEILAYLDMWDSRKVKAGSLSGGMKKKVEDAKIFLQEPSIAMFDEPTAYLDPPSRYKVWRRIEDLKKNGSTIILATNMMDEADKLCDRVGILFKGNLAAVGSGETLKDAIPKGDVIEIQISGNTENLDESISDIQEIRQLVHLRASNKVRIYMKQAETKFPRIMERLIGCGIRVESVDIRQPSLDDVFLHFTGDTL